MGEAVLVTGPVLGHGLAGVAVHTLVLALVHVLLAPPHNPPLLCNPPLNEVSVYLEKKRHEGRPYK